MQNDHVLELFNHYKIEAEPVAAAILTLAAIVAKRTEPEFLTVDEAGSAPSESRRTRSTARLRMGGFRAKKIGRSIRIRRPILERADLSAA